MTGATDLFEDDNLDHLFTNTTLPNVGDAAGLLPSAAPGSFHISLHTGDAITDASTLQTDSEAAYTGYARQAVARSVAGWTVASGNVDNDAAITFPTSTSGPETETDVGIGFALAGAGVLQIWSQLLADLIVNNGITPEFAIGALDISLD
ncbi:MAG: hypothetical protein KAI80_01505 [Hyphomicrobiaceae bacterium]|nr:hypothetical protein [Hyphomicrobiaceae bacterium]MCK5714231.1 hypothetical protein [Hyphomicrobiaceae bacterium]